MSATATAVASGKPAPDSFSPPNLAAENPPPTRAERMQTINGYVAPDTEHGQSVVYYPQGVLSKNPQLAVVVQQGMRGQRTLRILGNRLIVDAVPHIGDPRLKESAERRSNGAWDLTDYDKRQRAEIAELRESIGRRFAVMEDVILQLSEKVDASAGDSSEPTERQKLLQQAKEMGVQIKGNPSAETLRQAIAAKAAELAAS